MEKIKLVLAKAMIKTATRFSSDILDDSSGRQDDAGSEKKKGRIITLFSTKGGVGKTVVASNLAAYLALQKKNVCLVDFDLQFGDVALMLKIEPKESLYKAIEAGERLDKEMLESLFSYHEDSGLKVLLAPVKPDVSRVVSETQVSRLLALLTEIVDFVIVDTPSSLDRTTLAVVDASDRILLVASMDLPSVKNVKIVLGMLEILNIEKSRINLVLNRADSRVGLSFEDIEQSIGKDISWTIPSDRIVPRSVNLGVPFVIDAPRAEVSRSFEKIGRLALDKIVKEKVIS